MDLGPLFCVFGVFSWLCLLLWAEGPSPNSEKYEESAFEFQPTKVSTMVGGLAAWAKFSGLLLRNSN